MISRTVAQAIARDAIRLEAKNAKILRENLLAARTKLANNPSKWQYEQFGGFIDEVMGEYEAAAIEQFPVEDTLAHGQKEGQLFTGVNLDIPKDANYWQWKPTLPLNAISLAESDFAKLIGNASSDFKKEALRTVQQGLAMGGSTQDLMDDLLGVGISGEKGRDGKFRKAVNRAEAIARTVSNDLINRGAMMTYEQIDRTSPELNLQKIWQTLSDNRTSERCLSLSGQVRELNENFQAGDGWIGKQPPAHPYCRSRVTSRAKNAKYTEEIDEKFKQQELAAIALQPEPTPEPEPLSEPLPTPKKEKKAKVPKVAKAPVPQAESGQDAIMSDSPDPFSIMEEQDRNKGKIIAKKLGVSKKEGDAYVTSLKAFTGDQYREIRQSQKDGTPNKDAQNIEEFLRNPKTPKYKGEIFRGIVGSGGDDSTAILIEKLKKTKIGEEIELAAMASHSTDLDVAKDFTGGIIYHVKQNKSGVAISALSDLQQESEVLLPAGVKYKITKITLPPKFGIEDVTSGNPAIIELEEV